MKNNGKLAGKIKMNIGKIDTTPMFDCFSFYWFLIMDFEGGAFWNFINGDSKPNTYGTAISMLIYCLSLVFCFPILFILKFVFLLLFYFDEVLLSPNFDSVLTKSWAMLNEKFGQICWYLFSQKSKKRSEI